MYTIDEIFGPEGLLVDPHANPPREYRPGQHQLAVAIARQQTGMFQGPTGTGKTYAYLGPAIISAGEGKRTVIGVSTNALLDQIVEDIPKLAKIMRCSVSFAALKGRDNYACLDQVGKIDDPNKDPQLQQLVSFIKKESSDLTQYKDTLIDSFRNLVTTDRETCKDFRRFASIRTGDGSGPDCGCEIRGGCSYYRAVCIHGNELRPMRCPALVAREAAMEASVVVTNYHLLILNCRLNGAIFGEFNTAVLDEAHALNATVRDMVAMELGPSLFKHAAKNLSDYGQADNKIVSELIAATDAFFHDVAQYAIKRSASHQEDEPDEALISTCHTLSAQRLEIAVLEAYELGMKSGETPKNGETPVWDARKPIEKISKWLRLEDSNIACWAYHQNSRSSIHTSPVNAAPYIRATVHTTCKTVIAVSATLSPDGTWDYPRSQLAMPHDAIECAVPSPFNYAEQALWFTPSGMPKPKDREAYNSAAARITCDLVRLVGGRSLVLCSARKDMKTAAEAIEGLGYKVLIQGQYPPRELKRRFKDDATSCLIGCKTYGTGLDVVGEALQCVILWKLPFAKQTMVDESLKDRLESARWFRGHYMPAMLIELQQWIGRLIRTRKDVGVIGILDSRAASAQYRQDVLSAMPTGLHRVSSLDAVSEFLLKVRAA